MLHSLSVRFAFLALLALLLAGCSLLPEQTDETQGWSAQRLYSEAKDALNGADYERAVKLYERLEARYPYGRYAQQAQLEVAYAHYRQGDSASALAACDRFIKLHPSHPSVDYAYFLKGVVNFNTGTGIIAALMSSVSNQDASERDPRAALESFNAFKDLVMRFPQSRYVADATARMNYLINGLAQHEVHVARYYLRRGAYLAAANRAQYAIKTYQEAPAREEALFVMVSAYDALGMTDLRDDARRVLERNFPDSVYLKGDPKRAEPWWKLW